MTDAQIIRTVLRHYLDHNDRRCVVLTMGGRRDVESIKAMAKHFGCQPKLILAANGFLPKEVWNSSDRGQYVDCQNWSIENFPSATIPDRQTLAAFVFGMAMSGLSGEDLPEIAYMGKRKKSPKQRLLEAIEITKEDTARWNRLRHGIEKPKKNSCRRAWK